MKNDLKNACKHLIALIRELLGAKKQFGIRGAYVHRKEVCYFDDTSYKDEYQKEVYEKAAEIGAQERLKTIYDVGCGSGYKLLHYLSGFDTTGFDVPKTVHFLQEKYPERNWRSASFSDRNIEPADLVVCSDVIEHVLDPDDLIHFILSLSKKWIVISTPDRSKQHSRFSPFQLGPPQSDFHVREWAFDEFRNYLAQFADIREHFHPHPEHSTQMIVATKRLSLMQ